MSHMKIKKSNHKKVLVMSAIAIVIIAACIGVYALYKARHQSPSNGYYNPKTATPTTNVPVTTKKPGQSEGSINSAAPGGSTPATPSIDPSIVPSSPVGTFVSNHSPNLSGNPAPNTETSACTTTPGAKCEIIFSQGNLTKTLQAQTTDAYGNTSWNWTLQSIGITEGTWKITAVATNGSNQTSAADATNLQVRS